MSNVPSLAAAKERQLNEVLAKYLESVEAGESPDREVVLAEHPDLAGELHEFFANLDGLPALAGQGPTIGPGAAYYAADNAGGSAPDPACRFGDYEIIHEIARGGMGIVYRARQISLDREVALKMILGGQTVPTETLRRFRIEAEAAARLDHPNIVPIYEVGSIDAQPYFTMKLVEGGCLNSRLDEFRLPSPDQQSPPVDVAQRGNQLADLLATVARAVHHAHLRGILHRDLKPANILLDGEGRPLVADFGLAKNLRVDNGLTQSDTIVGTASFMAPEQAQPTKGGLTTAADVYSLGAILYVLLTGRPPFAGETYFDTLLQAVEENPVPPRQRNPRVPPDLEAICLKCLAKEPTLRYGTALQLAEDLERWRAGDIISLSTPTTADRFWRWARRNRLAAALLATLAGLMVVVTIASVLAAWNIGAARDRANANAVKAEENAELADAKAKEADDNAQLAQKNAQIANGLAATESVARIAAEKAKSENQRLLVSGYVANGTRALDGGDLFGALVWYGQALKLDQGDPAHEEPHRVRLASVLRRCPRLIQVWFNNDARLQPAFSPDGRRVVLLQKDTACLWDVADGAALSAPLKHDADVERAAFSPDGSRLVTVAADGTVRVWDGKTGEPLTPMLKHDKAVHWAAFSPDGTKLATVGADRGARVWDTATGKMLIGPLRSEHPLPLLFASFSPDGKRLTVCGGDRDLQQGEVRVWDLSVAKPTARGLSHKGVLHWAYLVDNDHVVATGGVRTAHLWTLPSTTGRPDPTSPSVAGVRMVPDGAVGSNPARVLKLEGLTAQVYDLAQGKPIGPPLQHSGDVLLAVLSLDGKLVATAGRDRTVRVWDVMLGKPITPPLRHGGLIHWAEFSADDSRLLTTSQDGIVHVWELASRELAQPLVQVSGAEVTALSPDGRLVAISDKEGAVWVRDAASQKVLQGPWKLPRPAVKLCFAPDRQHILAASEEGALIWDALTGQAACPLLAHSGSVQRVLFSPDGSRVAIQGAKDLLDVYDARTGSLQSSRAYPGREPVSGPALTPDGRTAVVVPRPDLNVELRDFSGALRAGPFRHAAQVAAAVVSPDGKRLAVGTVDGSAYLWDLSGRPAAPLMQHGAPLRRLAFSGDSRRLVTVADDHSIRVWDVATGQPVSPLLLGNEQVSWVGLSADGHRLSVTGKNGVGSVWDLSPDTRPVDDLMRLVELLSGETLDGLSGGFVPAEPARLNDAWPQLRAKYPQEFSAAAP